MGVVYLPRRIRFVQGHRRDTPGTISKMWRQLGGDQCGSRQEGKRLSTVRFARMPETKKKTLKDELRAEFDWAMRERPKLWVVKIADGAPDNWDFLRDLGGEGVEILDFYHAATHLKSAADAVHGAETAQSRALFESWKTTLREDPLGAEKVIRALAYRRGLARGASRKVLEAELNYFRAQRHGMLYQQLKEVKWPIGSGVVEAACKTVVSERLPSLRSTLAPILEFP